MAVPTCARSRGRKIAPDTERQLWSASAGYCEPTGGLRFRGHARRMHPLLRGPLAGTVATVPMSAVMLAASRLVGRQPPEAIARSAVQAATGEQPPEPVAGLLSSLAHLGFGAGVGAGYVLLPRSGPPLLRGVGTALAVYVVSYQGWVPALGILPPASRDRPGRPAVMVTAHMVFGAVLALVEDRLRRPRGLEVGDAGDAVDRERPVLLAQVVERGDVAALRATP